MNKRRICSIIFLSFFTYAFGSEGIDSTQKQFFQDEVSPDAKVHNGQSEYKEKSGLLLGVHTGVSIMSGSLYQANGDKIHWNSVQTNGLHLTSKEHEMQFNIGVKIGWSWFFTQLFGVRAYVNYDYNNFRSFTKAKLALEETSIISDVMVNFFNKKTFSFGIFAGIGFGYALEQWSDGDVKTEFEKKYSYHGFIVPFNIGLSTTIKQQHKIELATRIPLLMTYYQNTTDKSKIGMQPYVISLGYTYIFNF